MNSTNKVNKEEQLIKAICDRLSNDEQNAVNKTTSTIESRESYFISGTDLDSFHLNKCRDFDINDIQALQLELINMWNSRKTPFMLEFLQVCTVAAMKGRNQKGSEENRKVSEFVYEF